MTPGIDRDDVRGRAAWTARALPDQRPPLPRILFCEDQGCLARVFTQILAGAGVDCTVEHVMDGNRALERLVQGRFDLLVTDEMHPGVRGARLCSLAKTLHPDLKVVMWTGVGEDTLPDETPTWDAFLSKPATADEVVATVSRALRR